MDLRSGHWDRSRGPAHRRSRTQRLSGRLAPARLRLRRTHDPPGSGDRQAETCPAPKSRIRPAFIRPAPLGHCFDAHGLDEPVTTSSECALAGGRSHRVASRQPFQTSRRGDPARRRPRRAGPGGSLPEAPRAGGVRATRSGERPRHHRVQKRSVSCRAVRTRAVSGGWSHNAFARDASGHNGRAAATTHRVP